STSNLGSCPFGWPWNLPPSLTSRVPGLSPPEVSTLKSRSNVPLRMLVGLLNVWSRTCCGASPPPPPPPQAAISSDDTSARANTATARVLIKGFLSCLAAPQGSASPLAATPVLASYPHSHEGESLFQLWGRESRPGALLHLVRHAAPARLPQLRRREPGGGEVLHGVWIGSRVGRVPTCAREHSARGGAAGGAAPGEHPVRRPFRIYGRRRAHGSGGGQGTRRSDPAPPRRSDRALRRLDRQVHRRQRDGCLRGAGRTRGRSGAGCPGRARH